MICFVQITMVSLVFAKSFAWHSRVHAGTAWWWRKTMTRAQNDSSVKRLPLSPQAGTRGHCMERREEVDAGGAAGL